MKMFLLVPQKNGASFGPIGFHRILSVTRMNKSKEMQFVANAKNLFHLKTLGNCWVKGIWANSSDGKLSKFLNTIVASIIGDWFMKETSSNKISKLTVFSRLSEKMPNTKIYAFPFRFREEGGLSFNDHNVL